MLESMFSRLIADADWLQSEQQETPPARQVHAEPTFTLSQIVEYCKGRVVWEDARPIVAMLNTLLRGYASREDFDSGEECGDRGEQSWQYHRKEH